MRGSKTKQIWKKINSNQPIGLWSELNKFALRFEFIFFSRWVYFRGQQRQFILSGPLDTRFHEGLDIPGLHDSTGEIRTLFVDGLQKTQQLKNSFTFSIWWSLILAGSKAILSISPYHRDFTVLYMIRSRSLPLICQSLHSSLVSPCALSYICYQPFFI